MDSSNDPYTRLEKLKDVSPNVQQSLPYTKRRTLRSLITNRSYRVWHWTDGSTADQVNSNRTDTAIVEGTQITTSEGHPFRRNGGKGKVDLGGNFYTQKRYVEIGDGPKSFSNETKPSYGPRPGYIRSRVSGPILPIDPNRGVFPDGNEASNNTLDVIGTKAINAVKPTNPVGGLTTALAELHRDGLPHLLGSSLWEGKMSIIRSAGDEYLNKEFGWDPLRNDISDFIKGVTHASDVIKRYKQGIGKPTRRRFDFDPIVTETSNIYYPPTGFNSTWGYSPWTAGLTRLDELFANSPATAGALIETTRVVKMRWFSGSFTYYFPEHLSGKLGDAAILARELGLNITPETVWQATPWSWAVDWFSDLGDVISNFSSFQNDGLVMIYGYAMEHTIARRTYRLVGAQDPNGTSIPVSSLSYVVETKQRRKATPYGFGLSFGSFSNFQKSILGALGLTKLFR